MNKNQSFGGSIMDLEDDEIPSSWNPMRDEYEDLNVNVYDHGPGAQLDVDLQRPAYRDKNNRIVYKIMVNHVPRGLTEVGLENLLMYFGSPTIAKCQKKSHDHLDWALVEFKTLKEAQHAIRYLDASPPFNMKVNFARSDKENERLKMKHKQEEDIYRAMTTLQESNVQPHRLQSGAPGKVTHHLIRLLGRGQNRGKSLLNVSRQYSERRPGRQNWSNGSPDCRDSAGLIYNPGSDRFKAANRVVEDMIVTIGGNSSRKVSLGRGYVPPYHAPAFSYSGASIKKCFGKDLCLPVQLCQKCGSETIQKCSQCGAPYCSKQCQKDDFARHRPMCLPKESIDVAVGTPLQQPVKALPLCDSSVLADHSSFLNDTTLTPGSKQEMNVVSLLEEGLEARLSIHTVESGHAHGQLSLAKVFEATKKLISLSPGLLDSSFRPLIGAQVAVNFQETVWRAYILSCPVLGTRSDYTVALCDLGKIVQVAAGDISPLPSEFYNLPELAVTCVPSEASRNLNICEGKELSLLITNTSGSEASANVLGENSAVLGVVNLSAWVPTSARELASVHIVPPCGVTISAYHNQHALYVWPVGRNYHDQLFSLMQKVAAVHVASPLLDRPPHKGEMVACCFKKDGNYYRAVVTDAISNDEYSVFFVDYGNVDTANTKDMKILPQDLKMHPCLAVKVHLKGIKEGPLTEDAVQFLHSIIQKEEQLRLECSEEGVELFLPDNCSFNSKLNDFLIPEWKQSIEKGIDPHKGEIFMSDRCQVLPLLKNGLKTGDAAVIVVHIMRDGRLSAFPAEAPEVEVVLQVLSYQINEYCQSTDENLTYNPREDELCLVKYNDGSWYRAINMKTITATQSCEVVFVDYGNTEVVPFRDIRRMIPDFVLVPSIVSFCQIEGLPSEISEDMLKRLSELVPVYKTYEVKVVETVSPGECKVFIPEVSDQLKSEFMPGN